MKKAKAIPFVVVPIGLVAVLLFVAAMPVMTQLSRQVPPPVISLPQNSIQQASAISAAALNLSDPVTGESQRGVHKGLGYQTSHTFLSIAQYCAMSFLLRDTTGKRDNAYETGLLKKDPQGPCSPQDIINGLAKLVQQAVEGGMGLGTIQRFLQYVGPTIAADLKLDTDTTVEFIKQVSNLALK